MDGRKNGVRTQRIFVQFHLKQHNQTPFRGERVLINLYQNVFILTRVCFVGEISYFTNEFRSVFSATLCRNDIFRCDHYGKSFRISARVAIVYFNGRNTNDEDGKKGCV